MKFIKYLVVILLIAFVVVFVIGLALPRGHVAGVRAQYRAPVDSVYAAIADVEKATSWRSGLTKVEVLEQEPLRWRETADWGVITFVREQAMPPRVIRTRIADESEGFGGTWTYQLARAPNRATELTIIENGTVSNPLFRFMSRFVFGHYTSLETYAKDLGRRFGETPDIVRINSRDPAR
jgi:hypothetical protein